MKKALFLLLLTACGWLQAQVTGFEESIPAGWQAMEKSKLSLSPLYYKEGEKSLEWQFRSASTLQVDLETPLTLNEKTENTYGITLWIYNEKASQDSVRFEFFSPDGQVSYRFSYRLASHGWRACWIGFRYMHGNKQSKTIAGYRLVAPNYKGRIFIDRLTFPVKKMNDRTTPDLQMPTNNSLTYRDLWHWCRVWQWEQYEYDLPLPATLSGKQQQELEQVEERMNQLLGNGKANGENTTAAYKKFRKAGIRPSGNGYAGAPLLAPDEVKRAEGELSWNDLEIMLSGFANDAYYNNSEEARQNYFTVWAYAIDQGFAYGSGMGTNHHYGYQVRKIYTTAWLMRESIWQSPQCDEILAALSFWSALQETRKPYQKWRDELLDSWHTLLQAKAIAALMHKDERERVRALQGVSRWVSTSLQYTPGTIGGIKTDGTAFHHGGFYPAYASGALGTLGEYIALTAHTEWQVTEEARKVLRHALLAMRNYSNLHDWGTGLGGRHPFSGSMKEDDIAAFAHLALAGDLSGQGREFDHELAADYLRLCPKNSPQARLFKQQGIRPAKAPQGFFVYNYGAAGILRRDNWMVTLKGYNTDVWGSEIYIKDNRYGRYQSYGSVQIMNGQNRAESGYDENGWDWNRLPGTTTIHLPFELLNSPLTGTTMAHSRENFAGSSSIESKDGMFAIKLMERNMKNFTPDFVARKSVFCFGNRLVCLGTGITNSNREHATETTLFQYAYRPGSESIRLNGQEVRETGFSQTAVATPQAPVSLKDNRGNHYFVTQGKVCVQTAEQESRHEKNRKATHGTFATAYIDHGTAPSDSCYEYMIWIEPAGKAGEAQEALGTYRVVRRDNRAHIVYDRLTGITAYAAFEETILQDDALLCNLPAETMVMRKKNGNGVRISVCDPNLNIAEKAYTTKEPSRPIVKRLEVKGNWQTATPNEAVSLSQANGRTVLEVTCLHGQPVEFDLVSNGE